MTQREMPESGRTRRRVRHVVWSAALLVAAAGGVATPWPAHAARDGVVDRERFRDLLKGHTLRALDGTTISPGDLKDQVVVVNFWASWCQPCRRELPALDRLATELSKQGVRVIAISVDEDPENVRRFIRAHGLRLSVCQDGPNGLARRLGLDFIPLTVVLDRAGQPAFVTSGAEKGAMDRVGSEARRLLTARVAATSAGQAGTP